MNKAINLFSGIVLVLYCAFVMASVYDFSFSTASFKSVPYKLEITYGFTILVFLLGMLRIKRKWQGLKDMKNFKGFHFVRYVAKPALNLSLVYAIAEIVFMGLLLVFLSKIAKMEINYVLPMILVISFILLEAIVFALLIKKGGQSFRVGINKKAVAYFNREMHICYFTGLKRIELHQDMVNFQYIDDLNILVPLDLFKKEDVVPFKEALIQTIETEVNAKKGKNIYIDDGFRNLK